VSFLSDYCTFSRLTEALVQNTLPFDCGHRDLNDFFEKECHGYSKELLGKSYCFLLSEDPRILVCAFTLSNDSIKVNFIPNSRRKRVSRRIPRQKQFRSYPAVLIGRLGVNNSFKGMGVGHELMDFIKTWFLEPENKTGCRFLVVDSYSEVNPLNYYGRNGFDFVFSTEDQEKEYMGQAASSLLATRLMYFDLMLVA
jgi:GNAT superfamily N-acetyltransferase